MNRPATVNRVDTLRLATLLLLGGCAGQQEYGKAQELMAQGKTAEAVENLRLATTLAPDNLRYRLDYLSQRTSAGQALVTAADAERAAGQADAAAQHYRDAARIDPGNERSKSGLQSIATDRRAAVALLGAERLVQANQTEPALDLLRQLLRENPGHAQAIELRRTLEDRIEAERQAREQQVAARAAFKRPVTLQFRDTPLKMVFEALSKAGNVNVIVDRDVKSDLRTTIYVKDASIEDALDVILLQNQLDKRVLNSNTLLIYPANAAKQKELAELKIRTFALSNVDVAFMANIIKTMLKTKDLVTDVKSNTLVMRDTPDAIALAERLIAANDQPDAEIMLEVEVLEISSTRSAEIGLKLPTTFGLSTPDTAAGGPLTLGALRALTRNDLLASPLAASLNLMLTDGDTNILARPRIRSRNKEKAKILVGDKLPVITNIISPQPAGQNSVLTGSIQYVDVGIKLEVESQAYADGDVGIKLNLEVSNVSDTIITQGGRAYAIGSRSAQTTLRLRDGETQIMAGLISDEDRKTAQKVPGIGQLPVVGKLFSDNTDDAKKREIVLAITPHIIRPQAQPDLRFADAWSGTDSNLRDRQLRLEPLATLKAPAPNAAGAPTAAPGARRLPAPPRRGAPADANTAPNPVGPALAEPAAEPAADTEAPVPSQAPASPTPPASSAPAAATEPTAGTPALANSGSGMPGIPPVQARPVPGRGPAPAAPAEAAKP